jgi:hypothetical protein
VRVCARERRAGRKRYASCLRLGANDRVTGYVFARIHITRSASFLALRLSTVLSLSWLSFTLDRNTAALPAYYARKASLDFCANSLIGGTNCPCGCGILLKSFVCTFSCLIKSLWARQLAINIVITVILSVSG